MDRWIRMTALVFLFALLLFAVVPGSAEEKEPDVPENVTFTVSSAATLTEGTVSNSPTVTVTVSLDPALSNDAGLCTIDNCTITEPRVVRIVHVGDSPDTENDINVATYTILGTETNRSDRTETPSITLVVKNSTVAQRSVGQGFATLEVSMIHDSTDAKCQTLAFSASTDAGTPERNAKSHNDYTTEEDTFATGILVPFLSRSRYYSLDVQSEGKSLWVDMTWEGNGDHVLTIYYPSGILGTFRDDSDGREDGRIFLRISQEGGIETGPWHFKTTTPLVASSENDTFQMYLE